MSNSSKNPRHVYAIAIITTATTLLALTQWTKFGQAEIMRSGPEQGGYTAPMVAIYCGPRASYHNQYIDENKKWKTDHDTRATCTKDKQEILEYCRKVYPNRDIHNIVESAKTYKIDNWCKLGQTQSNGAKRQCKTKLSVKPYRCLEGAFQSDALLVPERCMFDHVHNKSICEGWEQWNQTASVNCERREMILQSYAMLQPCGVGVFSGVEFVCCPKSYVNVQNQGQNQNDNDEQQIAINSDLHHSNSDNTKYQIQMNSNDGQKSSSSSPVKDFDDLDNSSSSTASTITTNNNNGVDDDEYDEDEYDDDDEDEYDDDSTATAASSLSSRNLSSPSTTTSTTTTTTTTTTERPIDRYLGHFDLAHEHDEFRRAEKAVENDYRDKITQVMKEWSELEEHYQDMKLKDPQAAEEFKKKMTQRFQKTVEALEEEGATERRQLISMHSQRVMTIINRRKKSAMDCLTQALDRVPTRTRQVERCIERLLRALEKDRSHTLHQYKHLLASNTRDALREKQTILEHLVTLNRAANQSIAMMDRSPQLVEKLKDKVVILWHNLRGIPLDEPITRESELKTMERYEEEIATKKIERERQKLLEQEAIQDSSTINSGNSIQTSAIPESNTNSDIKLSTSTSTSTTTQTPTTITKKENENDDSYDDSSTESKSTTSPVPSPVQIPATSNGNSGQDIKVVNVQKLMRGNPDPQPIQAQSAQVHNLNQSQQRQKMTRDNDIDNEIHYEMNPRFAHMKSSPSDHHDLSYSVKPFHAPTSGNKHNIKWSNSVWAMISVAFACVVSLFLFGVVYYRRHSARSYRAHGFLEVGQNVNPEQEKHLANMQINGYENPTYKYFEAQA